MLLEPSNPSAAFAIVAIDYNSTSGFSAASPAKTPIYNINVSAAVEVFDWLESVNEEKSSTFASSMLQAFPFAAKFGAKDEATANDDSGDSQLTAKLNGLNVTEDRDTA